MKKIKKRVPKIKKTIINYISSNVKEFILVSILFILGIFVGVIIINNCNELQGKEISTYISEFITRFKNIQNLDRTLLIINSIKNNIILAIVIWLAGTTVIGVPVVLTVILFRGMCLGYTISAISYTLGSIKRKLILYYFIMCTKYFVYTSYFKLGSK